MCVWLEILILNVGHTWGNNTVRMYFHSWIFIHDSTDSNYAKNIVTKIMTGTGIEGPVTLEGLVSLSVISPIAPVVGG